MNTQFEMRLQGYRLTTAEILYHMPDYPEILQTYVWQQLDLAPKFPILRKFLDHWQRNLDGKLHTVRVGHNTLLKPEDVSFADASLELH